MRIKKMKNNQSKEQHEREKLKAGPQRLQCKKDVTDASWFYLFPPV
jgi:hypothetical protein